MQRDSNWFQMRLGKITASEFHKIMGSKGLGQTGETYLFEKIAEILTGETPNEINNEALRWGTELEPIAKDYYNKVFKCSIIDVDFITSGKFPDYVGASPDGIIKDVKGLEIKCPFNSANHAKYLTIHNANDLKKIEKKYYWQVMLNLYCSEFDTWEFISFDPRFKGRYRMKVVEIKKDPKVMNEIEDRLFAAIKFIETNLNLIQNL